MNKKRIIIVLVIVVGLTLVAGGLFFLSQKGDSERIGNGGVFDFLPFGRGSEAPLQEGDTRNPTNNVPQDPQDINSIATGRFLTKVWPEPISGATFVETETSTNIRFVEKATGNVYQINLETGQVDRLTNTTLPKFENIVWNQGASAFIGQRENNLFIETLSVRLLPAADGATTSDFSLLETSTSDLPPGIVALDRSPETDRIFYLVLSGNGVVGYIANFDGSNRTQIWQSAITGWVVDWVSSNEILLTTKASVDSEGYSFVLSTNGNMRPLIGPKKGLTLSYNNNQGVFIYSETSPSGENRMYAQRLNSLEPIQIAPYSFPEKCIWTSQEFSFLICAVDSAGDSVSIDDWYKGLYQHKDQIWVHDTARSSKVMSDLGSAGIDIDATNLTLSPEEDWLLFANQNDSGLWLLPIEIPEEPLLEEYTD